MSDLQPLMSNLTGFITMDEFSAGGAHKYFSIRGITSQWAGEWGQDEKEVVKQLADILEEWCDKKSGGSAYYRHNGLRYECQVDGSFIAALRVGLDSQIQVSRPHIATARERQLSQDEPDRIIKVGDATLHRDFFRELLTNVDLDLPQFWPGLVKQSANQTSSTQHDDRTLATRERNNLLKTIAVLVRMRVEEQKGTRLGTLDSPNINQVSEKILQHLLNNDLSHDGMSQRTLQKRIKEALNTPLQ